MDTKQLLYLTWLFAFIAVLVAAGAALLHVGAVHSSAVCIDGELRAINTSGTMFLVRKADGSPIRCESQ